MCGIVGFFDPRAPFDASTLDALASGMAEALRHRGPDDGGVWGDPEAGIALGHRRLAILDLSPQGRQPMLSTCGRYVVVFNGEIYNHLELRAKLEALGAAPPWRGHSDTETLLAAVACWGLRETLTRCHGMFALALWDREQRTLQLARDRMGEKPLYYGWVGDVLLFGSELKALRAHSAWRGEVDRGALVLLLRYGCVPAPHTIYRGITKLPPGSVLTLPGAAPPEPYWSLLGMVEQGRADPFPGDEIAAADALERLLGDAIARQGIADVPLGAFLSGGIDSSLIVALMQARRTAPVRTFTIGFQEADYDEAAHARAVARHLGTEHTELYVTPAEAREVIPELPRLYDEPFADSSQIPTALVARLARRHVTVALSGDGGDELFGGYTRHLWVPRIWGMAGRFPLVAREGLAALLRAPSPRVWDGVLGSLSRVLPFIPRQTLPGEKLHKLAEALASSSPDMLYRRLVSGWKSPTDVVLGGREPPDTLHGPEFLGIAERMMFLDALTYLPDDILVKVDRAAMGVGLETRTPFLDHDVVAFAWRLPLEMKLRHGQGKWLLREVLYRHVPRALLERPKQGFGVPIGDWLRGPLREWAESLLDERRLTEEGFFRPEPIRRLWKDHLVGRRNGQHPLWSVLMFQSWWEAERHGR